MVPLLVLDISHIEARLESIKADFNYLKDVMISRSAYEAQLWGIQEQKKFETNKGEDEQKSLEDHENLLLKNIDNTNKLVEGLRQKILKALGKM